MAKRRNKGILHHVVSFGGHAGADSGGYAEKPVLVSERKLGKGGIVAAPRALKKSALVRFHIYILDNLTV